jgi:hypothetical protein
MLAVASSMPESRREIDEKCIADLPNRRLFASRESAIYSPSKGATGFGPTQEIAP